MKTGRCHRSDNESCSCDGGRGGRLCQTDYVWYRHGAGPVDTTRFTAVPGETEVPDVGFCDITDPAGTVDEDWVVTVPTTSPAPVMAVEAADCVRPTTFGTDTDAELIVTLVGTDVA